MAAVPFFGRKPSTNRSGGYFSDKQKLAVWDKAQVVVGLSPEHWRQDRCGALIHWDRYGDTTPAGYGWEIDHVVPVAHGGSDDLSNLQPLHWQNNRAKGDSISGWTCAIVRKR